MNLALKYRPKSFSDVVGQKAISAILNAMIRKDSLYHALLFEGPTGVGKTSMARIVAAALNPDSAEDVHNRTHSCVLEIDAASHGTVAAMRELKESLNYSVQGNFVVIIDEAHAMSPEGFDVLLNILEYPIPGVTFILCTTEINQLESAIRHRCDEYNFKRASTRDILTRLEYVNNEEGFDVTQELLNLITERSEGSYRAAMMLLERAGLAGIKTEDQYRKLFGEYDFGADILISCLQGPGAALVELEKAIYQTSPQEIIEQLSHTLKDVLILKAGNSIVNSPESSQKRKLLSSRISIALIVKAVKIVWDLQTKMTQADATRNLQLAVILIADAIQLKEVVTETVDDKPLSLEELQQLTS